LRLLNTGEYRRRVRQEWRCGTWPIPANRRELPEDQYQTLNGNVVEVKRMLTSFIKKLKADR
jgi:hypothetical protein